MKVVIRVDASLQIGTGHVMRCLTLAEALKQQGAKVEFICREHEGNLLERIGLQGFNVYPLTQISNFSDPDKTLEGDETFERKLGSEMIFLKDSIYQISFDEHF